MFDAKNHETNINLSAEGKRCSMLLNHAMIISKLENRCLMHRNHETNNYFSANIKRCLMQ